MKKEDNVGKNPSLTRRSFLKLTAGAGAALAGGLGAPLVARGQEKEYVRPVGEPIHMFAWSYAVDMVRLHNRKFETKYKIPVSLGALPTGPKYIDLMIANFIAGTQVDIMYLQDLQLLPFMASGWVVPYNECKCYKEWEPKLKEYIDDMEGFFKEIWVKDGTLWGLPYYTSAWSMSHNETMYKKVGITKYPETWDEVKDQGLEFKKQKILEYPYTWDLGKGWWLDYQVTSMVYSEGAEMFDKDLEPVLDKPGSVWQEKVEWCLEAMHNWKVLDPKSLELNEAENWRNMANGGSVMTMSPRYRIAQVADHGKFKEIGGKTAVSLMPGKTHGSVSWTRAYVFTKFTKHPDSWKLIDYLGGKGVDGAYTNAIDWMKDKGLDGGYKSLWKNPIIIRELNKWGDAEVFKEQNARSRGLKLTPWYTEWILTYRTESHKALIREVKPAAAAKAIVAAWRKGQKDFPKFKPTG